MIKISTKGRYGMRLMLELAVHYDKSALLLKEIAKRQGISNGYLDQLVPYLKTAGLIKSSRMAMRGYLLAKHPKDITALAVIEALEGNIFLSECLHSVSDCSRTDICVTRLLWSEVSNKLRDTLKAVTLADLVDRRMLWKKKEIMYNI